MNLEDVREQWLNLCGSCDAGLAMNCTCPAEDPRTVIAKLVREVEAARERTSFLANREHIVGVQPKHMDDLRKWLQLPNGSHILGRVTFEAVEGGGLFVRTRPYGLDSTTS